MRYRPYTLNQYRTDLYGRPDSPRWVRCGWCGRSISHAKDDERIFMGDDGLVYCFDCRGGLGYTIDTVFNF